MFLFIGADPNTDWLRDAGVKLDGKGFVLTGNDVVRLQWQASGNQPHGIFAIGDVRAGSVKRVAASVGEGAQVVAALHAFLADALAAAPDDRPAVAAALASGGSR